MRLKAPLPLLPVCMRPSHCPLLSSIRSYCDNNSLNNAVMLEISGVKEQDFHAIKATHNRKSVSAWGFIWRKRKIRWAKEDAF